MTNVGGTTNIVAMSIVRRVSSVSTITTRNNKDIKSIFGVHVWHELPTGELKRTLNMGL